MRFVFGIESVGTSRCLLDAINFVTPRALGGGKLTWILAIDFITVCRPFVARDNVAGWRREYRDLYRI